MNDCKTEKLREEVNPVFNTGKACVQVMAEHARKEGVLSVLSDLVKEGRLTVEEELEVSVDELCRLAGRTETDNE
ncbi:MAG: hypothetical protein IJ088_15035 [Clostridia bacterium]|nr:hypothetical protein [Clostridia bacterium]